ncbi:winged helix-turn-helix domain-containing protein [Shewanella waksmanii]|uniref:winged helix-turn-helix domain-containing protein n=1 Tax=Shewanella waksmanii TaxID=213783 RepID=UPI003735BE04
MEYIEKMGNLFWLRANTVVVGEFVVDFKKTQISRNEQVIKLEPLAMELLCYLISRKGEYVNQKELLENVWNGRIVSDNAIRRVVKKLRDALGDEPKSPKYIKTVPNKGYLLIADVVIEDTENDMLDTDIPTLKDEINSSTSITPTEPKKGRVSVLTSILIVVVFGYFIYSSTLFKSQPPIQVETITSMPGEAYWANFNPKNGAIVFSHRKSASGYFDLYLKNPQSHTIKRLTRGEANHNVPTWSNSGDRLAYQRQSGEKVELVVLTLSDELRVKSSETVLTYDSLQPSLNWSPDDSALYFVHRQSIEHPYSLFSLDIASRELEQVTFPNIDSVGDYTAQFSPDGKYLAMLRYQRYDRVHLMIIDINSGKVISNHKLDSAPITLSWDLQSEGVYFASGDKIYLFDLASGSFSVSAIDGSGVETIFDNCGKRCLIANTADENNRDIKELVNPFMALNGALLDVFELPMAGDEGSPVYTNKSDEVVFRTRIDGIPQIVRYSDLEGMQVITQFDSVKRLTGLQFNPETEYILGLRDKQVFVLNATTANIQLISQQMENAQRPNWSADGKSIYYSRQEPGTKALIRYDIETQKHHRLFSDIIEAKEDKAGQYLYILSSKGELSRIAVSNFKNKQFIATIPTVSNISWHAFEESVYYTSPKGKDFILNKIDLDTMQQNSVPWQKNTYYAHFDIHPSGRKFLVLQDNIPNANLVSLYM